MLNDAGHNLKNDGNLDIVGVKTSHQNPMSNCKLGAAVDYVSLLIFLRLEFILASFCFPLFKSRILRSVFFC